MCIRDRHYIVYSYNLDANKEEYSIETDQTIYSEEWPKINTINNRKLFLNGIKNKVVIDYKKGEIQNLDWVSSVSYTHLDVYKRQFPG